MKIKNISIALLSLVVLMLSGCGNPSATTPPSVNVSINKYFVTGASPTAAITPSPNNPFTNNLSVVSLVTASKTTLITIPKTTTTSNPAYSESITSSTAASFNALMVGVPTKTLPATTISDALTAETLLREREKQQIASVNPVTVRAAFQQQALMAPTPLVTASSGSTATFNVWNFNTSTNQVVNATCQYVGNNAYIFVDNTIIGGTYAASSAQLAAISTAFDAIYATDRATFGSEWGGAAPGNGSGGIDNDPKIYILISPAVNSNNTNGYLGYFYGGDEFPTSAIPLSNRHEMFYVVNATGAITDLWADAATGTPTNATKGYNILAHEFQHMINFNTKYGHNGLYNGVIESTWLNEGLSMYAMQACGYGLTNTLNGGLYPDTTTANHVSYYLNWPETLSLTNWTVNNYGMSYLYVLYLVEQYGGGVGTAQSKTMLQSMESNSLTDIANVESVTGTGTFGTVFKNWAMANLLDHTTTNPAYGYASINLHNTYGGVALPGIVPFVYNTYPRNANIAASGWSARYEQFTSAIGALNISIQNNSGYNYLDGIVVVQ